DHRGAALRAFAARPTPFVTTGLDPVVHAEMPCTRRCHMDTRVKPAYDGSASVARLERAKAGMGYLSRRHGASPSPARPTPFVTTALDPVVHAEMPYPGDASWIRGSSPRMTDQQAEPGLSVRKPGWGIEAH